ncbi:MAG: hypothetical protein ACLPN1_08680, partial [Dissulfurispiraceae bacterium]
SGTNILAGTKKDTILSAYQSIPEKGINYSVPSKWDGRAAERIWSVLVGQASQRTLKGQEG